MRRTMAANTSASSGLSLLQCGELLHFAIDRLSIEGADSLSPHGQGKACLGCDDSQADP